MSSNEFITKLTLNSLVSYVFFFIDFNKNANLEICWIVISEWRVVKPALRPQNRVSSVVKGEWSKCTAYVRQNGAAARMNVDWTES